MNTAAKSAALLMALVALSACEDGGEAQGPGAVAGNEPGTTANGAPSRPVTEADLGGVPVYPGAELLQPQSSVSTSARDNSLATGTFEVDDAPSIVAAYYRQMLREIEGSPEVIEMVSPSGQLTLLADDPANDRAWQVQISPVGMGSHVQVIAADFPSAPE